MFERLYLKSEVKENKIEWGNLSFPLWFSAEFTLMLSHQGNWSAKIQMAAGLQKDAPGMDLGNSVQGLLPTRVPGKT